MKNKIILVLWISCLLLFDVGNGTLGKVRIQSDIVSLTVSSDGITKEDAIKNALRNAIEQAFGTFVSANTSILNDELIKDEIVTISKGNIISYKELSSVTMPDGRCFVTIKTNVSISKLADYATNKGAEVEFAGATFGMNLKMMELNKLNEEKIITNMLYEMERLYKYGFDYSLKIGQPKADGTLTATVMISANGNGDAARNLFFETINYIAMTDNDKKEYEQSGLWYAYINIAKDKKKIYNDKYLLKEQYAFRSYKSVNAIIDFFNSDYLRHLLDFSIITNLKSSKLINNSFSIRSTRYINNALRNNALRIRADNELINYPLQHYGQPDKEDITRLANIKHCINTILQYHNTGYILKVIDIDHINGYGLQDAIITAWEDVHAYQWRTRPVLYYYDSDCRIVLALKIPPEELTQTTKFEIKPNN